MSNRSTSTSSTIKSGKKHSLSTSGEAAGGEPEGEVKPRSRNVSRQPGKDSSGSNSSSDSGTGVVNRKTTLGDEQSTADVDVKDELLDADIHDLTRSDQSNGAASKWHSGGARKERWWPGSSSHGTDAAGWLSEDSNEVDTETHATTQAFSASPATSSMAILLVREQHEEHEPKHESFLKTIAKASSSLSSFSYNEPLSQVSIAIFSICLLFVIVACSVIAYSCGMGACAEAADPAINGTTLAAARAHRKTDASKSGHMYYVL
ncbi:uncharacterized protein [Dermacentor albipictus]|uniref:uncharacterized protein n=1 Tax=Dermacentor albipictus TaxID=60249 RepID=UPI0031FD28AF